MNTREQTAIFIGSHPDIIAAGLPAGEVYQADTLESPSGRPFIVLRWLAELQRVGASSVIPVEAWIYDERGDYTRADRIGNALLKALHWAMPMAIEGGHISQFVARGDGTGRGRDMFDAGYDSVVIPYYFKTISSGA